MADFEAPSFSLGFDFDLDSDPNSTPAAVPSPKHAKIFPATQSLRTIAEDDDDDDDFESPGLCFDPKCTDPPPTLKRLRRGSTSCKPTSPAVPAVTQNFKEETWCDGEEDIEEFSSQEDRPDDHPKTLRSLCSSSKIPLHRHGEFSSQSASQKTTERKNEDTESSAFENMGTSGNKFVFTKSSVSPLRRFQLIDSDSDTDDPSITENLKKDEKVESHGQFAVSSQQRTAKTSQNNDLWEDFLTDKNFNISTPALDEVCEEYFKSQRGRNDTQNAKKGYNLKDSFTENIMHQKRTGPIFPAHNYFSHKDLRIQKLVRDRLPHFSPLGAKNSHPSKQNDGSIDYTGQFENRTKKVAGEASSTKCRKKNNPKEASQAPEGWVNPRNSAGAPKDAGKRRVQAASKSAGHWFLAGDGKRVYVTGNGKELTGQLAYRQYRRESGAGFKKSKKKGTANKKSSAKKGKR